MGRPFSLEGTRLYTVVVPGRELTLLAPPSADEMLDTLEEGDELPFWAHLWDSSHGLCGYLARRQSGCRVPLRMLELGCGVGAVGCAAAAMGWRVTMTDYQVDALRFAACNLDRNGLRANLVLTDWRSFAIDGMFDLVVGSDVLYESTLHDAITGVLSRFLQRGATALLADPGRPSALKFAAEREKEGWQVDLELLEGREGPIAVYCFRIPASLLSA